ncbi:hypothetical protein AALP_AA1G295600 [Arabis alpina]|uniref:LYK3/4/5 second LysM domain-containing protein n=1 Tax=Arabis alpina TaxID=50452 RepID=A0A087HRI1_ARAAL|nr:hypothetical protein AALP_AA1G295600 [Arabis alpina]
MSLSCHATYTLSGAKQETYFSVANDTYQALSTCQTIMSQNPYDEKNLVGKYKMSTV